MEEIKRIAAPLSGWDEARAQLAEWEKENRPGVSLVVMINDDNEMLFNQFGEILPTAHLIGLFTTAAHILAADE